MRPERAAYIYLAAMGIAMIINLYSPVYPPGSGYFWSGIFQDVIFGILTSVMSAGLFLAAWRKALAPGEALYRSMTLSQKALIGFCGVGLLRGALPLLLIPFPRAGWVFPGILILQIAGSAALALMVVPVLVSVYREQFQKAADKPLRDKVELVLQAALSPAWIVGVIVGLMSLFSLGNGPDPVQRAVNQVTLLVITLLVLAISLLHLRERKLKWFALAAVSALGTAYSIYWLLSGSN